MKSIITMTAGALLAVSPFVAPVAFAATTTTMPTITAMVSTTTIAQNVSKLQMKLQTQIASLLTQIKAIQAQLAQIRSTQKTITNTITQLNNKQLQVGSRGKNVEILQKLLASDPNIYPQGLVTGYYGRLTEAAVRKFQEDHGIESVGEVGPQTRMLMNAFLKHATTTIPMNFLRKVEVEQQSATSTDHMVVVCHRAGNSGMRISERIARMALFFHVRNGDSVGKCENEQNNDNSSMRESHSSEHGDMGMTTSTGDTSSTSDGHNGNGSTGGDN